jgi:L-threonylcarbamoyladenylate synthase
VTDPATLDAAAAHLQAGRAVVVPTDTVYGLAVLPSVPGATDEVFAVKGRPADVPLAVLVDSLDQALTLVEAPSAAVGRVVSRLWPGPLTVVLARRPDVTVELGGDGTSVGVRCPDHDLVRALARRLGPLAVTSANLHGQPTPKTAAGVAEALGPRVALVVDGGPCTGTASTVVDGRGDDLRVLREGPISAEDLQRAALP